MFLTLYNLFKVSGIDLYHTFIRPSKEKLFILLLSTTLILAATSQLINEFFYKYPHSHQIIAWPYFKLFLLTFLIHTSIKTIHPKSSLFLLFYSYVLLLLSVSNFVTNSIIITPFPLIDKQLQYLDDRFHFSSLQLISFIQHHSLLRIISWRIYFSLIFLLFTTPVLLLLTNQHKKAYQFLNHLLLSVLCAGVFYYFFPSTGPATISDSNYYTTLQHSIYFSFHTMHSSFKKISHAYPFLSAPSIHTTWALLIMYAWRKTLYANKIIIIWAILIIMTTLTTGWHFLTDILLAICFTGAIIYLEKVLINKDT